MATILYFHGFASMGNSSKVDAIREHFKNTPHQVIAPDLPADPDQVESIIDNIVRTNATYPLVFAGTSLGGFWANYAAQKYDAPCVIVNPASNPSVSLAKYMDAAPNKHYIGELDPITPAMLQGYANREKWLSTNTNGKLINLFLAKDDDVLSFGDALKVFKYTNYTRITLDGGHRYYANWVEVLWKINDLV